MKKRLLSLLLVLALALSLMPAALAADPVSYAVDGGNIYFDPSTGLITGCDESVTRAAIPDAIGGVTVVGMADGAFSDSPNLTAVIMPDTMTQLGAHVFGSCANLTDVRLSRGLTSLSSGLFMGCESLRELYVPETVTRVSMNAFDGCSALRSIDLSQVTELGSNVFFGCSSLTQVRLGEGLIQIPWSCFDGCSALTRIDIPEGVTLIDCRAFNNCESLRFLRLPESLEQVETEAFRGCEADFYQIYYNGTADQWDNVTIDDFRNPPLTNGHTIYFEVQALAGTDGNYYVQPDSGVIVGCDAWLKRLEHIPSAVNGVLLTDIAEWAFSASDLEYIEIPEGVTTVGAWAFANCTELYRANIPDSVYFFGSGAFKDCPLLEYARIPQGTGAIPYGLYMNCDSLVDVEIPYGVTVIDTCAFQYCDNLQTLTIPYSVTAINQEALADCPSLTDIYYSGTEDQWNAITIGDDNDDTLSHVTIHYGLGAQITTQPRGIACFPGNTVEFIVDAVGNIEGYQWLVCKDDESYAAIPGATSPVLTVTTDRSMDGNYYRCAVTVQGSEAFLRSDAALLRVPADLGEGVLDLRDGSVILSRKEGGDYISVLSDNIANGSIDAYYNSDDDVYLDLDRDGTWDMRYMLYFADAIEWYFERCDTCSVFQSTLTAESFIPAEWEDDESYSTVTIRMQGVLVTGDPEDQFCFPGKTARFTVAAEGEDLRYQWYYSANDGSTWRPATAAGNKTDTLSVPATASRDGYLYRCVVTDGSGGEDTSYHAALRLLTDLGEGVLDLRGGSVTLPYDEGIKYVGVIAACEARWEIASRQNSDSGTDVYLDLDQDGTDDMRIMLVFVDARELYFERCKSCSLTRKSLTSNSVPPDEEGHDAYYSTVTVLLSDLVIHEQPRSTARFPGKTATFTVGAEGEGLTYQWYYSTNGGNSWNPSPAAGNKTDTLSVPVTASRDGYRYRCLVKCAAGAQQYSDEATLYVITDLGGATLDLRSNSTFRYAQKTGADIAGVLYENIRIGDIEILGEVKEDYTELLDVDLDLDGTADLTFGWEYYATNAEMSWIFRPLASRSVGGDLTLTADGADTAPWEDEEGYSSLTIRMTPAFIRQPWSTVRFPGTTVTFTVEADGENVGYQWLVSTDGQNFSVLGGETSDTLTVTVPDEPGQSYYYRCNAYFRGGVGWTESSIAILYIGTDLGRGVLDLSSGETVEFARDPGADIIGVLEEASLNGDIFLWGELDEDVYADLNGDSTADFGYHYELRGGELVWLFTRCDNITIAGKHLSADGFSIAPWENDEGYSSLDIMLEPSQIASASLKLEGEIGVNYYVVPGARLLEDDGAYAVLKCAGRRSAAIPLSSAPRDVKNGVTRYVFTQYTAAKEMSELIELELYTTDGAQVALVSASGRPLADNAAKYSVARYCGTVTSSKGKALAKKLGSFGAYAMVYFNYTPVNPDLGYANYIAPEDVSAITSGSLADYKTSRVGAVDGLSISSISLTLEAVTTVNLSFTVASGHTIGEYAFRMGGKSVTPVKSGSRYYLYLTNIAAKDLGVAHTLTVTKGSSVMTVTFSGLSYAYNSLKNYESDQSKQPLCDMCRALYAYNQAAIAYFS